MMTQRRTQLAGKRADDVVGLEALVVEDGDAEGFKGAANVGLLLDEVGRGLDAVGLVAAILDRLEGLGLDVELLHVLELAGELVAVDGGADVVDGGEVLGREVLAELVDHVDEDIGGGGGDAGARGHGALALHGVVGAEDEGHGVEQVDGGLGGLGGHVSMVRQRQPPKRPDVGRGGTSHPCDVDLSLGTPGFVRRWTASP